ncbi:MAG: hypothetical protein ACE365_05695 [Gammaproteobacteria bacterium]
MSNQSKILVCNVLFSSVSVGVTAAMGALGASILDASGYSDYDVSEAAASAAVGQSLYAPLLIMLGYYLNSGSYHTDFFALFPSLFILNSLVSIFLAGVTGQPLLEAYGHVDTLGLAEADYSIWTGYAVIVGSVTGLACSSALWYGLVYLTTAAINSATPAKEEKPMLPQLQIHVALGSDPQGGDLVPSKTMGNGCLETDVTVTGSTFTLYCNPSNVNPDKPGPHVLVQMEGAF